MSGFLWFAGWFFTCCVVILICVAATYSCTSASERYYQAQKDCMANGGSWINSGNNDGWGAHCLRLK